MMLERRHLYELLFRRFANDESSKDIASDLQIDAAMASKALQTAFEQEILRLSPPSENKLADELVKEAGMERGRVYVADCFGDDPTDAKRREQHEGRDDLYLRLARRAVGAEAALRLASAANKAWARTKEGGLFVAGFSGGRTVLEALKQLQPGDLEPRTTTGEPLRAETRVVALATAGHKGGQISLSANFAAAYLSFRNPSIQAVGCPWQSGDMSLFDTDFSMVITGISDVGKTDEETVYYKELDEIDGGKYRDYLTAVQKHSAGEVLYQAFSREGNLIVIRDGKLVEETETGCNVLEELGPGFECPYVAMPLKRLKQLESSRTVVLVAAGRHLADAVIGARKAGLFNVLICDDQLARALIEELQRRRLADQQARTLSEHDRTEAL